MCGLDMIMSTAYMDLFASKSTSHSEGQERSCNYVKHELLTCSTKLLG